MNSTEPENKTQVQVNILGQYIKNISFESMNVPQIFTELKEAPQIELDLDVGVSDVEEGKYEVVLKINAKATSDEKDVFNIELEYAGLFQLDNVSEEDQKKQILLIYCPNILFPFLRRIISDVTRDAGFQPLMLNPVDFAGLYMKQQEQDNSSVNSSEGSNFSNKTVH